MARAKKSAATAEQGIQQIMDVEPLKTIAEGAEFVGLSALGLQELFSRELNSAEPMGWEVIPQEYEHLLNAFKAEVECIQAEAPRFGEPESEPEVPSVEESPLLQEESEAPKAKQSKRKSTGLTKQRMNAVQKTVQDTVTLEEGIHSTELDAATQEGIQDGGQIATTYLVAKQVAENKIRKEAAKRRIAKTIQKTAKQKDFDPLAVLQKHGLNPTSDDLAELNELATPAMASLGNASGEILSNSWANGLQIDCTDLNALMSDAWSD